MNMVDNDNKERNSKSKDESKRDDWKPDKTNIMTIEESLQKIKKEEKERQ